jgi:hypothetical protein
MEQLALHCWQTPLTQPPPLQDAHAPLAPHWADVWLTQLPLESQQPFVQVRGSQTHWPLRQARPLVQALFAPHLQPLPPKVQLSAVRGLHAVHCEPPMPRQVVIDGGLHWPLWQQPVAQDTASHVQTPFVQSSPGPQAEAPPQPQPPSLRHWFAVASQMLQKPF